MKILVGAIIASIVLGISGYYVYSIQQQPKDTGVDQGVVLELPLADDVVNEVNSQQEAVSTASTELRRVDQSYIDAAGHGFKFIIPDGWYAFATSNGYSLLKTATYPDVGATEGFAVGDKIYIVQSAPETIKGIYFEPVKNLLKSLEQASDWDGYWGPATLIKDEQIHNVNMIRIESINDSAAVQIAWYHLILSDELYTLSLSPYRPQGDQEDKQDIEAFMSIVQSFSIVSAASSTQPIGTTLAELGIEEI